MPSCVFAGVAVGGVTKWGVDAAGDAEGTIADIGSDAPNTKYFRDKAAKLEGKIDEGIENLNEFDANAWKMDLMDTLGTTISSWKLASGMVTHDITKEGMIDPLFEDDGIFSAMDDLFDFAFDFFRDFEIPDLLRKDS